VAFQVRFVRSWAEGSDARGEWGLEENDVVDDIMTHSNLMTHCYLIYVVDDSASLCYPQQLSTT